jgi:hypothetical protein
VTRATIKSAYQRRSAILEPHGVVGWAAVEQYLRGADSNVAADPRVGRRSVGPPRPTDPLLVSVETAHPAKFPDEVRAAIGIDPEVPPSRAGLEQRRESYENMPAEYEPFGGMLATAVCRKTTSMRFGTSARTYVLSRPLHETETSNSHSVHMAVNSSAGQKRVFPRSPVAR